MRETTNALIELVANDMLDAKRLVQDLLGYMSEAEVKDFAETNDYSPFLNALDYLDEDDEPDVDESQEWHDFDPDC